MITGMDFVALPVQDMARARAFYTDVLGLPPGESAGPAWSELDLGAGPALALVDPTGYGLPWEPSGGGSVGLAFRDFEGVASRMGELGLLGMDPFETEGCHGAPIQDPEGNGVMVHRRKDAPDRDHAMDFVAMPVADMARAKAFYVEHLGLTPDPDFPGDIWAEFQLPDGSTLALFHGAAVGIDFAPNKGGGVGLRVPELEAAFERLKAAGFATAPKVMETPVCHLGFVADSEGNSLFLHRHK